MDKPLIIDYYTDILCIWAWIAQRRIDELNNQLKDKIEIRHFFVDVFGDVPTKITENWADKGGYDGYADHIQKSTADSAYAVIDPKVWREVRPTTSANAHLILKAIETTYDRSQCINMAYNIRKAFFIEAQDIGNLAVLFELVKTNDLDQNSIKKCIENGTAMASLMRDYQNSKQQTIKGSPSYVLDGGRQTLYGNVGYRVLHANVEELLKKSKDEASWC